MNVFEQKNTELVAEFDRYGRDHPDFAERIPGNALSPSALRCPSASCPKPAK